MRPVKLLVVLALCFGTTACKKKQIETSLPAQPDRGTTYGDTSEAAQLELFFNSDYTLCDAHFVSKTFGFDLKDSKVYIGQKIAWGTTDILEGDLQRARQRGWDDRTWRCQFYQTGYTYDDARMLAQMWQVDVSDAKVRIEDKILSGNEWVILNEWLPEAKDYADNLAGSEGHEGGEYAGAQADLAAFFDSAYDACHAQMLVGTYFGDTLSESKELIGYKAANGWTNLVDSALDDARARHQANGTVPCQFYQTPYTYDDAEALAALWGTSLSDAKARVESKYAWGNENVLVGDLEQARQP